jgi:LacI family transcriptional regulator
VRSLRAHRVDGVIVATSGGYEDIGVPAVFFDNAPADVGAGAVAMQNEEGVALLVDHLARAHGHERIAYLGPPDAEFATPSFHLAARERLDGFRAAMGRAGLAVPPEHVRTSDLACSEPVAQAIAVELLRLERPPTAIVAGADTLAVGVLKGLREQGRRVPQDVAVVSFDEPAYADLLDPPVTSLDRHDRELGHRAAELLVAALGHGNGTAASALMHRVPMTLCRRRSCGCGGGSA